MRRDRNRHYRYPRRADWVILMRMMDGTIIARNCLLQEEIPLTERQAIYLKKLDGTRNPCKIENFSYQECMEYYKFMKRKRMLRNYGRRLNFGELKLYTLYIPKKRRTNSVIPKILHLMLCVLVLPLFLYGLHLVYRNGLWIESDDFFVLNLVLGMLGTGISIACHEVAHAAACLSNGGWVLEAGVMMRGMVPGAYVWLDDKGISRLKKAQINLAGIKMNILIASLMMILASDARYHIFSRFKTAMVYMMLQNLMMALFNVSLAEGLDGEHTLSALLGCDSVVDAARADMQQFFRKDRKEYLKQNGIHAVAKLSASAVILASQFIMPVLVLADISMMIGDFFL